MHSTFITFERYQAAVVTRTWCPAFWSKLLHKPAAKNAPFFTARFYAFYEFCTLGAVLQITEFKNFGFCVCDHTDNIFNLSALKMKKGLK